MRDTLLFTGSIGTGKTTLSYYLLSLFTIKDYNAKYIQTSIGHGFAYVLLKFLVHITKNNYVGNYYLSLWYNNPIFFTKILKIIMFLDIFFSPVIYIKKVVFFTLLCGFKKTLKKCILIADEYFVTMFVDYLYFTRYIKSDRFTRILLQIFFVLTLKYTKMLFKDNGVIIIFKSDVRDSMNSWFKREKTNLVDINLLSNRLIASEYVVFEILAEILREKAKILVIDRKKLSLAQIVKLISSLLKYHGKLD